MFRAAVFNDMPMLFPGMARWVHSPRAVVQGRMAEKSVAWMIREEHLDQDKRLMLVGCTSRHCTNGGGHIVWWYRNDDTRYAEPSSSQWRVENVHVCDEEYICCLEQNDQGWERIFDRSYFHKTVNIEYPVPWRVGTSMPPTKNQTAIRRWLSTEDPSGAYRATLLVGPGGVPWYLYTMAARVLSNGEIGARCTIFGITQERITEVLDLVDGSAIVLDAWESRHR